MLRTILKVIFILLGIILLVLLGLYLIPPKQEVIEYDYFDHISEFDLNSKVGWYAADDGQNYHVTWGAKKGLQFNQFDGAREDLKNLRLIPISDSTYDTNGNTETIEVRFIQSPLDSNLMIDVLTSKTKVRAFKTDSLHYSQEEIEYSNGDISLRGLLMVPFTNANGIAVVMIHGSGFSDRDNFWYMYQANYLATRGFTVLLPDKRGSGSSNGEWHTSSFYDFAGDGQAGIEYLKGLYSDKISKYGVLGLSQGAWISQVLQQNYEGLNFSVEVVGSATTPNEQVKYEVRKDIESSGAPRFIANPLSIVFSKRARGKRSIWWNKNGNFDPIKTLAKQKIPALRIYGLEDENVPVSRSLERLDSVMIANPELPITVKTYKGSGHGLFDAESGWIRNDYLDDVAEWISSQ